jgi:hypothetical protein
LERCIANAFENVIDRIEKPQSQTGLLLLVPGCSIIDVGLRQRPDNPPARHRIA